ncbi:MAG: thioredoxin reductase [Oceanospirillaceae bacterium]|jgi:thioredoxin reductase
MLNRIVPEYSDVIVIGGGPTGLATATQLKQLGVETVIILEREPQAGGVVRHCGHSPFGLKEFKKIMLGPAYAAALVQKAIDVGVQVFVNCSVVKLHEKGRLTITTNEGIAEISAKCVVLSTGVRETPRAPRLISGERPLGITTTGALQSMVYLKGSVPFKKPVIVGSELVSFSALLTCRSAAIKPVAMLEVNSRISAYAVSALLPKLFGIPLLKETKLLEIIGKERVSAVKVENSQGQIEQIECDGVLFTGQFVPESSLMRMGHLAIDHNIAGPVIDQYGQCSDPSYFAVGNVTHPVETAGWCWREGLAQAAMIKQSLSRTSQQTPSISLPPIPLPVVLKSALIKYITPQLINLAVLEKSQLHFQLRVQKAVTGELSVRQSKQVLWSRHASFLPERRILIPLNCLNTNSGILEKINHKDPLEIYFTEQYYSTEKNR